LTRFVSVITPSARSWSAIWVTWRTNAQWLVQDPSASMRSAIVHPLPVSTLATLLSTSPMITVGRSSETGQASIPSRAIENLSVPVRVTFPALSVARYPSSCAPPSATTIGPVYSRKMKSSSAYSMNATPDSPSRALMVMVAELM
jgi:hypothetical protein